MKRENDRREPRQHARDARRYYRQARHLKRDAATLHGCVPNAIIPRGVR